MSKAKKFAAGTDVPVERSKTEIESILTRFGADQFMYGWQNGSAAVAFRSHGRHIRFLLPMPQLHKENIATDPQLQQEKRRRWRALTLCIKAKLESVNTGIETFEESFMAHVILPNGQTIAEHASPLIAEAYQSGKMPALLPNLK